MKHLSYFLFPPFLLVIGIILIGISIYSFLSGIDYSTLSEDYGPLVGAAGFAMFGLMLTTLRTRFTIDTASLKIVKEYRVFGLLLSKDQIRIPKQAKQVIIMQKTKTGKRYIQAVVGFGYRLKSYDIFFDSDKGLVRIMNTDHERALKIAGFIKEQLSIDYILR
jgi:mRNA-degrading endonuclease HigB of HigAB toxin-antitoxin module